MQVEQYGLCGQSIPTDTLFNLFNLPLDESNFKQFVMRKIP